ncbi:MAG: amino acid adenylation domain-containing protein [Clostridium sp.]|nr:amino acid adenylation domain-containing protein [Clostridium sp.]
MDRLVRAVLEGVKSKKIQKEMAAELLQIIKRESGGSTGRGKEIAVIGMAALLPGAEDIWEFRENLKQKVDSVTAFPPNRAEDSRWLLPTLVPGEPEEVAYSKGGYIGHIDQFDHKFFRISPAEARLMDPSQRLFLETAWKAIEDGGYGEKLSGTDTGVYVGYNKWPAYGFCISREDPSLVSLAVAGNLSSLIAGRLSYLLDFKGPSMMIDTACSSSMAAFYEACSALRNGICDQAIAGGINLELSPAKGIFDLGIESASEETRAFGEDADGAVWGEGVAAVLLKPLDKALRDHDHIYGVVKGIAANQDGNSIGLTAPNMLAQKELYRKAWEDAGIHPESISFIEAHGTATKLGDPIEIEGLARAFEAYTKKRQFCAVSTVKTNIGHLNAASGIVGIIKAALSLKYREIYPLIHFKRPNQSIDFVNSPFYVNQDLRLCGAGDTPLRGGVNSFGFNGTNVHVVLEEAPRNRSCPEEEGKIPQILTLSAKSEGSLRGLLYRYRAYLHSGPIPALTDICYTANTGRGYFDFRFVFLLKDKKDFLEKLAALDIERVHGNTLYDKRPESFEEMDKAAPSLAAEAYRSSDIRGGRGVTESFLRQIGVLFLAGTRIDWSRLYDPASCYRVSIPTYAFERCRSWYEDASAPVRPSMVPAKKEVVLYGREDGNYSALERQIAQVWGEVLHYERIGIQDDYFELGGDSIYSSVIANHISAAAGIRLNMSDLLIHSSIQKLSEWIEREYLKHTEGEADASPIRPAPKADVYPLSCAQKRIYILNRLNKARVSYNQPSARMIDGVFDVRKCERIFQELIAHHEAFRTRFIVKDGEPCQQILPETEFQVEYFDMTGKEPEDPLVLELEKAFIRPFDLGEAPLIRVGLIRLNVRKHLLMYDIHHLISDGTTESILSMEFLKLYRNEKLPRTEVEYKDYALWHNAFIKSEEIRRQGAYWLKKLSGGLPLLNLPLDDTRPNAQSFEGHTFYFEISEELTGQLKDLARSAGATLYMVLLAAYGVLLYQYTAQEDIIVGTPVAGRNHGSLEHVIGVFINMLAMRNFPKGQLKFTEYVDQVKETAVEAFRNQDYPFDRLVEELNIERDLSRNPVFDTMFVLQNMLQDDSDVAGIGFQNHNIDTGIAKYDLTLTAFERGSYLEFGLEYATSLFRPETIERMAGHYTNILQEILADPGKELKSIRMMGQEETNRLLYEFQGARRVYGNPATVRQLFEEQAQRRPFAIALVVGEKEIAYGRLNESANRLAWKLKEEGVGRNSVAGVLLDRSEELFVSLLGVLKAGGAYLPIDPEYPADRIRYMLENSRVNILLTKKALEKNIALEGRIVYLDDLEASGGATVPPDDTKERGGVTANPDQINSMEDLMYVLYTSGSTGKPKGVRIPHRAVYHFIEGMSEHIDFSQEKSILALTTVSFDIFLLEGLLPLTKGMRIILAREDEQKSAALIKRLIKKHSVDLLQATPSRIQLILNDKSGRECFQEIGTILSGGEVLHKDMTDQLRAASRAKLYHVYGPTETTVWSAVKELSPGAEITIGKPIANTRFYILDEGLRLRPIGVAGELYIAGMGLAQGYDNDTEMTAQRFLPDPFSPRERMYRTGDMARWLPSGEVKFLGRVDHQVKIRGFRIELEEIEDALNRCPQVAQAAVVAKMDGSRGHQLYAYVVSGNRMKVSEVRKYLAAALPEYMVPNRFVQVDALPVTANGKIDRLALASSEDELTTSTEYVEPGNEIEEKICGVWKNVLELTKIGVKDDFFELGGNSLLVIKLEAEMEKIGYPVLAADIFRYKTISGIASLFTGETEKAEDSVPERTEDTVPERAGDTVLKRTKDTAVSEKAEQEASRNAEQGSIVLEGIQPFNEIFYRSCFYNSAFPILLWYGREPLSLLVNELLIYRCDTQAAVPRLQTDYRTCRSLEEIMREEGIRLRTKTVCEDLISEIRSSLLAREPVIVGVDCFYEPIRADTFQKKHIFHTLLVYGYQEDTESFHVIEHRHRDNLSYEKRLLHQEDLGKACRGFRENFNQDLSMAAFYQFRLTGARKGKKNAWETYFYNVKNHRKELEKGVLELKVFSRSFAEMVSQEDTCRRKMDTVVEDFNAVINAKKVERYKLRRFRQPVSDMLSVLEEVIEKWSHVRNVCAKYTYSQTYRPEVFRDCCAVLEDICILEERYLKLEPRLPVSIGTVSGEKMIEE